MAQASSRTKQKRFGGIPINLPTLNVLREMHAAKSSELLFPSPADHTQPLRSIRKFWAKVCKDADLPTSRLHDLRYILER
jgi:integrase